MYLCFDTKKGIGTIMKKYICIILFVACVGLALSACSSQRSYVATDDMIVVRDGESAPRNNNAPAQANTPQSNFEIVNARTFSDGVVWVRKSDAGVWAAGIWSALDMNGNVLFSLDEGKSPTTDFYNGVAVIATRERNIKLIDREGRIVWSIEEHGEREAERLFGTGVVDSIELIANDSIELSTSDRFARFFNGYSFVIFRIVTFEYTGAKFGVLDSNGNWLLCPTHDFVYTTTLSGINHRGSGIYTLRLRSRDVHYNLLTNEFVNNADEFVSVDDINELIEQNRIILENDTLTFRTERHRTHGGLIDPGFYDANGRRVIDLSSYNFRAARQPIFVNGYSVMTIYNDQGTRFMVVINKQGEQTAPPQLWIDHGNVESGLIRVRHGNRHYSFLDTNMNVVISDIRGAVTDFTRDGIATVLWCDDSGEIFFIDTAGNRLF